MLHNGLGKFWGICCGCLLVVFLRFSLYLGKGTTYNVSATSAQVVPFPEDKK
jgi:hypothetical protein